MSATSTDEFGRPGDGILADTRRRAALTTTQEEAGEMTSVVGRAEPGERRDWRSEGACLVVDPELFFPAAEAGPARDQAEATAKAVCAGCTVRARCLAWAVDALPFGVAGGLSEAERAGLRHRPRGGVGRAPVTPEPVRRTAATQRRVAGGAR